MLKKERYVPKIGNFYSDGINYAVKVKVAGFCQYYFIGADNRPEKAIKKDINEAFEILWENNTWKDSFTMDAYLHREIARLCGWKTCYRLPF